MHLRRFVVAQIDAWGVIDASRRREFTLPENETHADKLSDRQQKELLGSAETRRSVRQSARLKCLKKRS
jgi:hypothetical protein